MTHASPFAAYVGIDWDDQQHAVCLLPADGSPPQPSELPQQPQALAEWAAQLRQRFGGRPVAVCLEQSRGALVYALLQYDFLTLFPLNPKQLSDYRAALHPSGAKSDPGDAELLARFLREHADRLRAWRPDDAATRTLRLLTEQRRKWVQQRVALANELLQRLKESYTLALTLPGFDLASPRWLDLLAKFPSQRELQRASPRQLARWLPTPRRAPDEPPAEELQAQRLAAIRQALPLTTDGPVLAHARLAVTFLVRQLQVLHQAIQESEQQIAAAFAQHPDCALFSSFPGAGQTLAPRLAAAFGADRQKFRSALEIQQFSGIAPVSKCSGKSRVIRMRWACPKFLRQTFHEFARCSVKFSPWARAYFQMRKARGQPYHSILRALAFKWQRILFRCWQDRTPYDELRHQQRLRAAGSEILNFLPPATEQNP